MIVNLFKNINECKHEKISYDRDCAYCSDCGAYVEIKWYLCRCSCCNVKRQSYLNFNNFVRPMQRYCPNCGSKEYYIEEKENINFIDINFAVMRKEMPDHYIHSVRSQIWVDNKENEPQKLLSAIKL